MLNIDTEMKIKDEGTALKRNPLDRSKVVMLSIGAGFFCVYFWLAKQMEGVTFDTTFIAIFCTFLSSFITRCFIAAIRKES